MQSFLVRLVRGAVSWMTYMASKEIAETEKLRHFKDVCRQRSIFYSLQSIRTRFDAFLGELEANIDHLFASY
jgi:hypothetical protein